jgi:hypothetical protein
MKIDKLKYSEMCGKFLDIELTEEIDFLNNWNWIMEVVDAIDKLEFFSFDIQKQPFYNLNVAQVYVAPLHPYGMSVPFTSAVHRESKKEAVVEAIWEFLQLDNKLKE